MHKNINPLPPQIKETITLKNTAYIYIYACAYI